MSSQSTFESHAVKRARGFTLIEAMITVAVIAILASIALPAYFDYVRRGQLPEAFTYLSDFRVKMEQYYQDNRSYGDLGGTTCVNGAGAPAWSDFAAPGTRYFTFTCALAGAADNQAYTLTATGSAGSAVGHVYTLDSNNARRTTTFLGQGVTKSCWLAKVNDC